MLDNYEELYNTAEMVLETVNEVYAEYGVYLPNRQMIMAGDSVHDCEQVVISFVSLTSGFPIQDMSAQSNCPNPVTATFIVEIVREVPKISGGVNSRKIAPSDVDITTNAKDKLNDARLLAEIANRVGMKSWLTSMAAAPYSISSGAAGGNLQAMSMELRVIV